MLLINLQFSPYFSSIIKEFFTLIFFSGVILLVMWIGFGVMYFTFFWTWQNGQTPGNRALAIKVLRVDGQPLSVWSSILRCTGYINIVIFLIFLLAGDMIVGNINYPIAVIIAFLSILVGHLWMIWDTQKQSWYDKLAGAIVVKTSGKPHIKIIIFAVLIILIMVLFKFRLLDFLPYRR